jgi:hypothetical protein
MKLTAQRSVHRIAVFLGFLLLPATLVMGQGGSDSQHFFYTETNLHIAQFYENGTAAQTVQDVTAAAGAPLAGNLGGGLASFALTGDAEHVYFISANQHVNELVCCWSHNDISAVAGSPYPPTTSPLTSYADSYGEHVVYLGTNQHVYLLFYSYSTSKWSLTDLTAITRGALAATNSKLTSFADPYGEYISYSGTNQHIYWMYLTFGGSPWGNQDITAAAGGALAVSGTGLTSFADGYGEHIFYIGTNEHTYELIVTSSWAEKDLTALTGASLAVSGSGLTSFSDPANSYYGPGGEHVFYVSSGSNGLQVNELLFNGTAWTYHANLPGNQPPAAGSLALASLPGYDHNSQTDYEEVAFITTETVNCYDSGLAILLFNPAYLWTFECEAGAFPAVQSSLTGFIDP